MSKKTYWAVIIFALLMAIVSVITVNLMLAEVAESTEEVVTAQQENVNSTEERDDVTTEDSAIVTLTPVDETVVEEPSEDLDVNQRNEYIQSSVNYDGVYVEVTEDGFSLSKDFVWSDDTYWYDVDPEGFARYSYLYNPEYGDTTFKAEASDSLNSWVGKNTDIVYCMTAALNTVINGDTVTWYVVFREYPDVLVKVEYSISNNEYTYQRLF